MSVHHGQLIEYVGGPDFAKFEVQVESTTGDLIFVATVREITGWEVDGSPCEYVDYMTVVIKSDSCSTINFAEHLHLCGVEDFKNHLMLIEELYKLAFRHMGKEPQDGERW